MAELQPMQWDSVAAFLVILAIVPIALIILILDSYKTDSRIRRLKSQAQLLGLKHYPIAAADRTQRPTLLPPTIWTSNLMMQSQAPRFSHILAGTHNGIPILLYEFSTSGDLQMSDGAQWIVAVFNAPAPDTPEFELRGSELRNKLTQHHEIPLPRTNLARNYWLRGIDDLAVREFFSRPMIDYFETHGDWGIESRKSELMIYCQGSLTAHSLTKTLYDITSVFCVVSKRGEQQVE